LNCGWRCFSIKIKVKGYLKNITKNEVEYIDTNAIKNKNKISYVVDGIKHKLELLDNKIIIERENDIFSNKLEFISNEETKSEYYIKEYNSQIDINIITKKITIAKIVRIEYIIKDSEEEYIYEIEMSE
jgi:hypothetical protein